MTKGLSVGELKATLVEHFAPFIQAMNIEPVEITSEGARFCLPENPDLVRGGNIICGQAVSSFADTIAVLTLYAHNENLRALTTVEMNVQFLRPLFLGGVEARAVIQSNGKRMANVRMEFRQMTDNGVGKLAASANCSFAYL